MDLFKERIIDRPEQSRLTPRAIRAELQQEFDYTEHSIEKALSNLEQEGRIKRTTSFWDLAGR